MQLAVNNLTANYEKSGGETLPALGPITFNIASGEFVCLVGPSGCGKSTLIRILAGLQRPTTGQAFLDHQIISSPSPRVGMMFQDANLLPWRTVLDNIALPLEILGVSKDDRYYAAHRLLPTLDLTDFAFAYPSELSGGMAQRVAIGRVLIQQPDVLLLDEPFGALDALTREQISTDLLTIWARTQQTVLMVTHNIHEAVMLSDRVIVLSSRPGQIIADIRVTLKRPRQLSHIYSEEFGGFANQIRDAINKN